MARSKQASSLIWVLVAGLLSQNLALTVMSTGFGDQKNFFMFPPSPDPYARSGTPPSSGSHESHQPGTSPGTPPSSGSHESHQPGTSPGTPPSSGSHESHQPGTSPPPPTQGSGGSYGGTPPSHGSGSSSSPSHGSGGTSPSHGSGGSSSPSHGSGGTSPSHGSGGSYGGTSPPHNSGSSGTGRTLTPPSHGSTNCGTPPHNSSPSTPSYTPTPTHNPTPSTPSGTFTPPPSHPFHGTCDYWRSHPSLIWGVVGWWGSLGNSFGPSLPGSGSSLSFPQALSNPRTDGLGALYREGTASLLNSMVDNKFPYTTEQVRNSFVAALGSDKAAAAQASLFKQANEGRL